MKSRVVCCSVTTLLLLASGARSDNWTTHLADAQRSGHVETEITFPQQLRWTYRAPRPPQLAWGSAAGRIIEDKLIGHRVDYDAAIGITADDGRLYFGSSVDHHLHAVELETGVTRWTFAAGAPIRLAPTLHDGKVYFGSDDGHAYCLDADSGAVVWQHRAAQRNEWLLARGEMISRWPVRTGVLVYDGVAYFGAGIFPHEDIFLAALDAETGEVVWKRNNISLADAGQDDLSPQGHLLANERYLIVPSGRSLPGVFDRATGALMQKESLSWRSEAGGIVGGTRAHLWKEQLLASGPRHFVALNPATGGVGFGWFPGTRIAMTDTDAVTVDGSEIRRFRVEDMARASRFTHTYDDRRSELSAQLKKEGKEQSEIDGALEALRNEKVALEAAAIEWVTDCSDSSTLVWIGDSVVAGGDHHVAAYNAASGKLVWESEVEGEVRDIAAANGNLVVSTNAGHIYTFGSGSSRLTTTRPADNSSESGSQDRLANADEVSNIAEAVVMATEISDGFGLVVGLHDGSLVKELVARTKLRLYAVTDRPETADAVRTDLMEQGLYGHRVVVHVGSEHDLPYSNYFANLVLSEADLIGQSTAPLPAAIARFVKPSGGIAIVRGDADALSVLQNALEDQSHITSTEQLSLLHRTHLPGAANWSHQYGNAANTGSIPDRRIKGGLGVLWYGDPGPGKMVNRHEGAVGPVAAGGRFFIQGTDSVLAYDAFNGVFLWERANPEAIRTGVFTNVNPGNLAANEDRVFVMMPHGCWELEAATGILVRVHALPVTHDVKTYEWGYVAFEGDVLIGTATVREEIEARKRRRGRQTDDSTDAIFAIDLKTGNPLWQYVGKSISHHTIGITEQSVFFIDSSVTSEERQHILQQDKSRLKDLTGEARELAEQRLKAQDVRMAMSLDLVSGEKQWSRPIDVTDCSDIGIGGGKLSLMVQDGVILLGGANANGHYWKQFVAGEFKRRRLVALSAESGSVLWAKDANYRHRPIVVGSNVLAEPWMFDLKTGKQETVSHPLTGEQVPWSIMRTGHHCGMLTATEDMLLFRSGFTAFYDLKEKSGIRHFAGHRLGCWINAIPANGLVVIPEASAGCVCQFSISSTVVLEPRPPRHPWTIASSVGATKPVKSMTINFGAPGDRRDVSGRLWISHPRNLPYRETSLELNTGIDITFVNAANYLAVNDEFTRIPGGEPEWIYSSAANQIQRITVPLQDGGATTAEYRVTLHWAELNDQLGGGSREFDVVAQGKPVVSGWDITAEAGGPFRAVRHVIDSVAVDDVLVLEFVPGDAATALPCLNALEIERVDGN